MCGWIGKEWTDHIRKVLVGGRGLRGGQAGLRKKKSECWSFFTSFKFSISFCSFQKIKGEKKSEKHLKEITFLLMAISIMIFFSGGKNSNIPHLFLRAFYIEGNGKL